MSTALLYSLGHKITSGALYHLDTTWTLKICSFFWFFKNFNFGGGPLLPDFDEPVLSLLFVVSPLSVYVATALLANGADGNSKEELENILNEPKSSFWDVPPIDIKTLNKDIEG